MCYEHILDLVLEHAPRNSGVAEPVRLIAASGEVAEPL